MTDNGWSYTRNRGLRELLRRHGIRHLTTEPYRPRTNGKAERFHQTIPLRARIRPSCAVETGNPCPPR
jgi:transposase InsO family protein